jgi:YVTN family beta-propeller protein
LYVLSENGGARLTLIDAAKLEIRRSVPLGEKAQSIRLAPDGERLYFLDSRARAFESLELEKLARGRQIRLAGAPVDFDLSPDGRWACVSLSSETGWGASGDRPGQVQVLDLNRWTASAPIEVGGDPASVAVRFDGRQAFVANRASRSVSVIDVAAGKRIAHLALNARPEAMRFKPDGGELFVSAGDSSAVMILSAYRDEIDQPMLAGAEPRGLAVTKDNHLLFVANSAASSVSIINIDDRRLLASVRVGQDPRMIALTPDDQYALVLNYESGDLAVIRTAAAVLAGSGGRIPTLFTMVRVGSHPVDLAVMNK